MLRSVLEPDLLLYEEDDWRNRQAHCFERYNALLRHRNFVKLNEQQFVMSQAFVSIVLESFPWSREFNSIRELSDLRLFILSDLVRAHYVVDRVSTNAELNPSCILGRYVAGSNKLEEWLNLLHSAVEEDNDGKDVSVQIATWEEASGPELPEAVTLLIQDGDKSATHRLPLVWDETTWAMMLATEDAWPDLQRCVSIYFLTCPDIQNYVGRSDVPIEFEYTDEFSKSLDALCKPGLREPLVRAITKKVYGVLDKGLGDEAFRGVRRFRVTDFWRVHYRNGDNGIILDEFGGHDMGM